MQNNAGTLQDNQHKISTVCSGDVLGETTGKPPAAKENPGALAGATGIDIREWLARIDHNLKRESSARALARAVADCDPADRLPFLERIVEGLRAGEPSVGFGPIMAEARDWAAWASRDELKAYCLAAYEAMSGRDQAAFLGHLDRRAAA